MIELEAADSGSRQTVRVGDRASVRLPETATTGYRWQRLDDPAADGPLTIVEDGSQAPTAPRGAGGDRVFVFEAVRTGTTTVRLGKSRTWGDSTPVEHFTVTIDVRERPDRSSRTP